jgi:beta-glucosidase
MKDCSPEKGMDATQIAAVVDEIMVETTLEEKVAMMSGRGFFRAMAEDGMRFGGRPYRAGGGCERLGVPALYFTDGPRGVVRGRSTCFPVTMARGASWDRDLERRIGEVMGIETRAQGCTLSGAVCVNLLRHPGWGRAQETYGEDPYHLGEMGAALATGIQTHNVVATVKHYALNSIENARFKIDVRIDGRVLREVYLAHFKRILDAGCASVMSAYNKMNGEYTGQNRTLLTDILRHEWGFDGIVHSDWIRGVYQPFGASAGLDIENPEPVHFGEKLVAAVEGGQIEPPVIETACRRILTTIYRFACAEDPLQAYTEEMVASPGHIALAREAAEKSAVLLKNTGVLPLQRSARIGIFGRLAELENTGDNGSSRVQPPHVITALQGLSAYLELPDLALSGSEDDLNAAAQRAAEVDAAIIVVGTTAEDEGEFIPGRLGDDATSVESMDEGTGAVGSGRDRGGDRDRLRLPEDQGALIRAVSKVNPDTIVVIVSGSAIITLDWADDVAAILQTFYSGMEGGTALARLLFGEVSPSGKLPFTVARDEMDYPFFDKNADQIEYDRWHGYSLMDKEGRTPEYAFGHGLSYSVFKYRALKARRVPGGINVSVSVCNEGTMRADEIVQAYIRPPGKAVERSARQLCGFERVTIEPGETRTVHLFIRDADISFWNETSGTWQPETGRHLVEVGASSADSACRTIAVDL